MNRRNFLTGLGAVIGGIALDQAVPLGRVYSFPKELKCLNVMRSDYELDAIPYQSQLTRIHADTHGYWYRVSYIDGMGREIGLPPSAQIISAFDDSHAVDLADRALATEKLRWENLSNAFFTANDCS